MKRNMVAPKNTEAKLAVSPRKISAGSNHKG